MEGKGGDRKGGEKRGVQRRNEFDLTTVKDFIIYNSVCNRAKS